MIVRFAGRVARGWTLAGGLALALLPATAVAQIQTHFITLEWTAPGDDSTSGRATQYEMRMSTTDPSGTDTLGWWNGATAVAGLPYPSPAGATDSVRVQGLTQDVTYYFVLRTSDEQPNWSGFSNVAFAVPRTCTVPSASPSSLSATDDDGASLLTWSGVPDPSATALLVLRGTGSTGVLSSLASLPPSQTSYRDDTVGNGTYRYQVRWVSDCGDGPATSPVTISFAAPPTPTGPEANVQARPNPSSGPVSFVVTVPGSSTARVSLRLFDSTGRLTAVVADGTYPAGENTISWSRTSSSGDRVAPGYYELIGQIGATRVRERLVLLP